jgi:hypothetical protein
MNNKKIKIKEIPWEIWVSTGEHGRVCFGFQGPSI